VTLEERVAALEARIVANEKAADRAMQVGERALDRSEAVLTKRFEANNEIREAMRDQTRGFVTRNEFQWAIGAVILVLVGIIVRLLVR
jgi:hypothetical protein